MRDAARQLTDRFHLAGLAQRLFGVRPPLHLCSEFAGALEHAVLQGLRELAQFLFGMIALAFALAQLLGCANKGVADLVHLANRKLAWEDGLTLAKRRGLRGEVLHRAGHPVADRVGEQHC